MIRVALPHHLQTLAGTGHEVALNIAGPVTLGGVLDALEERYSMLRGTIRDHITHERRPLIRFFACGEDFTLSPPDTPLPAAVRRGAEPLLIIGAIAGG